MIYPKGIIFSPTNFVFLIPYMSAGLQSNVPHAHPQREEAIHMQHLPQGILQKFRPEETHPVKVSVPHIVEKLGNCTASDDLITFFVFRKLHETSGLTTGDFEILSSTSKDETEEEDEDFFDKSRLSNFSESSLVSCNFNLDKIVPQKISLLSNAEKSPVGDHYLPQQVSHNSTNLPLAIQPHDWFRQKIFSLRWHIQQRNIAEKEKS